MMKKILILFALFVGISTVSYSQSAGGSGAEKVSGKKDKRKASKSGQLKPRKQMRHFDSPKADPNIKHNGTSYRMQQRREQYEAEGDGFGATKRGASKR